MVEPGADDPECDPPHGDARDELPVAAERDPALPGQPDGRQDGREEREPVHVHGERPDVDDAGWGLGMKPSIRGSQPRPQDGSNLARRRQRARFVRLG